MKTPPHKLPGITHLTQDYFDRFEKVADYYGGDYRNLDTFFNQAGIVRSRTLPLDEVMTILTEQNEGYGCGHQSIDKIVSLKNKACAVVTGQQTGLFGGPLFTLYKALTAIKLAERLSRTCDDCYVPVFWLASDDHDFREVNHIYLQDKNNQPVKLTYEGHPVDSRVPVSNIILADEITDLVGQISDMTHPSEFKDDVLTALAEAYEPGRSFSDGLAHWLMRLLKPFGLIIIDGSDPRLKKLAASLFTKEICECSPSSQQARNASQRLVNDGYHSQVHVGDDLLNLFFVEQNRQAIECRDGQYLIRGSGKSMSQAQILAVLDNTPEAFSPNVLLRPLYQDALLPTVAYVAGPSELAYYAQMKDIYHAFDIPMPIIYPRKSVTLLEGKIEKVLDNYQLAVSDFWGDIEDLINSIARENLPQDLDKKLNDAVRAVSQNLTALEKVITSFEKTLVDTVEKTRGRIQGQVDMLEKKILQAFKKRNDVMRQQLYKAHNSLNPDKHMQERVFNITPFLLKYGFDLTDRIYEAIDITDFDHQIIRI